ncbi:MAG: hypothetical protein DSY42_06235 [Aquifex sp.]|nr:MAG: hypothetical protein DSY42_06235 [Aquifex sp.]
MKKLFLVISPLFFVLVVSCGQKVKQVDKESTLRKAEKAFIELEEEATKPAKELRLEREKKNKHVQTNRNLKAFKPIKYTVRTKYPIKNGYPVWFWNPNYGNLLGAVGIAKPIKGKGIAEQRRLAKAIAIAKLAKQIEIIVKSEIKREEINIDKKSYELYKKKFSYYSEHEVRNILIKNAVIEDEWLNPNTKELYIWVVIKP